MLARSPTHAAFRAISTVPILLPRREAGTLEACRGHRPLPPVDLGFDRTRISSAGAQRWALAVATTSSTAARR